MGGRAEGAGRGGRVVVLALALLALAAWLAPSALAEGGPGTPRALDNAALEDLLQSDPQAFLGLLLARFVPVLLGLVLAVLWYLKRDKIRGGMLPPPPVAVTTRPFGPLQALPLVVGALVVVPALAFMVLGSGQGWRTAEDIPLWAKVTAVGLGSLPAGLWIAARRRALGRAPAAGAAVPGPPLLAGGAPGSRPPSLPRALGLGVWTLCVSALVVVPVALVWAMALQLVGVSPEVQDLVQQVIDPRSPSDPWIIAGFGVLVAPFAEECIFRGMLYPAAKLAFGGDRRGMWLAAVTVSLVFAGIHESWLALLPLFTLAMVLTWVFETTNSLAAVICAHALHNFLSLVPLLLFGGGA